MSTVRFGTLGLLKVSDLFDKCFLGSPISQFSKRSLAGYSRWFGLPSRQVREYLSTARYELIAIQLGFPSLLSLRLL